MGRRPKAKAGDDGDSQLCRQDTQHYRHGGSAALGLNNVRALKNGAMGWVLRRVGWNRRRREGCAPASDESREHAREIALRIAEEEKLSWVSAANFSITSEK
jgi:hypothetical protein